MFEQIPGLPYCPIEDFGKPIIVPENDQKNFDVINAYNKILEEKLNENEKLYLPDNLDLPLCEPSVIVKKQTKRYLRKPTLNQEGREELERLKERHRIARMEHEVKRKEMELECRERMRESVEKLLLEEQNQLERHLVKQENLQKELEIEQQRQIDLEKSYLEITRKIEGRVNNENHNLCTICGEEPNNTVFIPCGHVGLCYSCAEEYTQHYKKKGCPLCRKEFTHWQKIFI